MRPLPPPDRPPEDEPKCRRCGKAEVYRGDLCKTCDDDYVAIMCSAMFVG